MYNVIVVDDEIDTLEMFNESISWEEYDCNLIKTFSSGADALKYLKEHNVDILITDIRLGEISGIDIARYCYENQLSTKIIFMSAYADFEYAQYAIEYQIIAYIVKPLSYNAIVDSIRKAVNIIKNNNTTNDRNESKYITQIKDYIRLNYKKQLTVQQIANELHLSSAYIGQIFIQSEGEKIGDHITKIRIRQAKKMILSNQDFKMDEIALQCGFETTSYFYKKFKQLEGITPYEFRKNNSGGN